MGVFHVFQIVQMVPNRAKCHILNVAANILTGGNQFWCFSIIQNLNLG